MKRLRKSILLILPALLVFAVLYVAPLANMVQVSFNTYTAGRIGTGPVFQFSLVSYTDLLRPAYYGYFLDTFRIGLMATLIGLIVGYPIAYYIARQKSMRVRNISLGLLVSMLFLNILVRLYALALTLGPTGILNGFFRFVGANPSSLGFAEIMVIAGLLHVVIPMIALTLVGTIQNINPALEDAAQVLGASRWQAFLEVTVPLSQAGITSAFLIAYTLCISAFVIPLVLGKGVVLLISNLVYSRYSEIANYPGGSAMAVVLLVTALLLVFGVSQLIKPRWEIQ
jgi:ABC-type spermidine/putrescine transport system permease subunit I